MFKGCPLNYQKINDVLSRSSQPALEDFSWLKDEGVTDIINFRTMYEAGQDFDEETVVKGLGINYHHIPSYTRHPNENNVYKFLDLVEAISGSGGKVHIHCKAGADRTGMYAFIYKTIKGIDSIVNNEKEWVAKGHNINLYPHLRNWAKNFIYKIVN